MIRLLTGACLAMLCLAALAADGRYLLTLDKALPDGAPRVLALDGVKDALTLAGGDASGVTLDNGKLHGKVTVGDAWYDLDCVVEKGAVTGKYSGAVGGKAVTGAVTGAFDPAWVGYRGPRGSGVFPGSAPPTDCDMKTGRNIVWATSLPNWGHGSPVVVKGRAFVLSEPGWKSDWPVLTCIDTADGKVLWEREVNHLPATMLSPEEQKEAAKKWQAFHETWRTLYTTFAETVGQKKPEEAAARFTALGHTFGGHRGGGYGQLRSLKPKPDAVVKEAGLHGETWHHGCGLGTDCIGMAYASPVSDGEHVYVTTTFAGAACYDFDGNLRWLHTIVPAKTTETYARSPLLYRDLLISDYFGAAVALDKATGELRWSVETAGDSIATPAIITVDGTDVLLTEGGQGGRSLQAVRLPDGKRLTVEGWGVGGTQILANSDQRDVAFFSGRGQHSFWSESADAPKPPAAVRFALDGETLKATVLWTGDAFVGASGYVGMTYHGGKLYCSTQRSAAVIDAATGKLLAGGMDRTVKRVLPVTSHLLLLAGDKFYGLSGSGGAADGNIQTFATLTCTSLDGTPLGKSVLTAMPVEGEKLAQTRSQVGWDRWPFAYGFPFTVDGNRLYVRGFDQLICIGEK